MFLKSDYRDDNDERELTKCADFSSIEKRLYQQNPTTIDKSDHLGESA